MMFALLVIPVTAAVGLAIDFGRVYSVASHTQAALDAAALAAGRVAQIEKTDTLTKASATASAYFNQAKPQDVLSSTLTFSSNGSNTEFKVTAVSWVRTPFLSVLNSINHKSADADAPPGCHGNYYGCIKITSSSTSLLQAGGNGAESLEIAMMLDVTGSMQGQKLSDLKAASKDLVDIVIWQDQSQYTSKVALAPFSQAVNVGNYFTAVTGLADDPDPDGDGYNYPPGCYNNSGNLKKSCKGDSQYKAKKYSRCVVERTGATAFTDASPATKFLNALDVASPGTACKPSSVTIVPLTSDRTKLKQTIDTFVADGSTAGHLGTAWAWYLISPEWASIWPAESRPSAYGAPAVKKIAVLMTDGEYNVEYKESSNGNSTTQARTLCTNLKAKGVEVYTVGFQLDNNSAITTLKQCATDLSHFYNTSTGDELRAAFRDIALKVSSLRLTH